MCEVIVVADSELPVESALLREKTKQDTAKYLDGKVPRYRVSRLEWREVQNGIPVICVS
jgi:hypothetical protein